MSYLGELNKNDLIRRLQPLFQTGWYVRPEDGKVVTQQTGTLTKIPWIFVKYLDDAHCKYYHDVCHKCFGFVHSRCLNCYKVVFKPRTVEQLFEVYSVMRLKLKNIPSKCGIEERVYVHGNYGCYWYGHGLEGGLENYRRIFDTLEKYELLQPLLEERDSKGRTTRLILKRACTEFEMEFGDSQKWYQTPKAKKWEDWLEKIVIKPDAGLPQPDYVQHRVKLDWLKHAYSIGDETALKFNDGEMFYPNYTIYHEGER